MDRRTVLAGALGIVLFPLGSAAAEAKRFKLHARLERQPDHREARTIDVTCPEGKTVTGIDGDKDFRTSPPTVMGLSIDFTAKADAGDKIALHAVATYRTTNVTIVGGLTQVGASLDVVSVFVPGEEQLFTMDVNGVPYLLRLSASPA